MSVNNKGVDVATKRKRGASWYYTVRRKNLLPKPIYLTFDSEKEGDQFVARLEKDLDNGIVPQEYSDNSEPIATISTVINKYLLSVSASDDDQQILNIQKDRIGGTQIDHFDYDWVESWLSEMKQVHNLAPNTIRHHVGALSRCMDWWQRKKKIALNPLRQLPKRYASYNQSDVMNVDKKEDVERERRLEEGEEDAIRSILAGEKPEGRQRALELEYKDELNLMFDLALETAMRMREIYTLEWSQVILSDKTIFLEKTKNGNKRQVPLSSVAILKIKKYQAGRDLKGLVLPIWSGKHDKRTLKQTTSRLSKQFSRVFSAAGCNDLRFHDLRHEATSRMFERTKMSDIEISSITGHSNPRILKRYANLRGSTLAGKLW